MRRLAITTICAAVGGCALPLAALAGTALSASGSGPAASAASPRTKVRLAECRRSARSAGRWATFYARMRRVRGTRRMAMRFTLLERVGKGAFEPAATPGLGRWRKSRRGVVRFGYRQTVKGLRRGASYRALVRFRWYDSRGRVIRRGRRRSRVCSQPVPRPNLRVVTVGARQGGASNDLYGVRVLNAGKASAPAVAVVLSIDGQALAAGRSPRLAPGEARTVRFSGPPCRRGVKATVDAENTLRESNEADNARRGSCPPIRP
jgi:hypothetical protein